MSGNFQYFIATLQFQLYFFPRSIKYCRNMSDNFQYFIAKLQFQLYEIFQKTNKYLILLEIF